MSPGPGALDEAALFDWLRLARSENVGPRTFHYLIDRFGHPTAALAGVLSLARRPGSRPVRLAPVGEVEKEREAARRAGLLFLPACDPAYPAALGAIDAPPPLLLVKGQLGVLARPMVAIVGSRNASAGGLVMTERFARGLGGAGYVVVSGLARGIDAKAHLASLDTGTVAVLAGGHDRIYPSEHAGLADRIAATGAVISEMPFGWEPRGRDFPRRNRIVSGLALGLLVVEAAHRSGSLITARFAGEQGRTVFAMPGSPLDPRADGTNALIRNGATLCATVDDLVEDLAPMVRPAAGSADLKEPTSDDGEALWDETDVLDLGPSPLARAPSSRPRPADDDDPDPDIPAGARDRLLDLVGMSPVPVDELVRLSGLPTGDVQALLIDLELDGAIIRAGAGAVARRPA